MPDETAPRRSRRLLAALRPTVTAAAISSCLLGVAASTAAPLPKPAMNIGEQAREQQAVAAFAARGLPVYCGGGRTREVALSFDDGPSPYTSQLLTVLRRPYRRGWGPTPATFFLIGRNASEYPAAARAEAKLGSVGEHTQNHADLTAISMSAARTEIDTGQTTVATVLGAPVRLFRPPDDDRNRTIDALVRSRKMVSVLYTVDPRDWALTNASAVIEAIRSDPRLVPGAIVLLHENRLSTLEALPAILTIFRQRDLKPVTVPQLLADDPPTLAEQQADLDAGSCLHLFRTTTHKPR